MNTTSTEVKTLKVALFALALGTMVEGFSQGLNFLGSGFWGIIGATLVALVFVTLFDLTATKNMFRVAKHHTGQEPAGKRVWIFYVAMVLGLVGTMAFSLLSVPVITDVSVGDTDADKKMMAQKQSAEARHNSAKNDAERIYQDAVARVKQAQAYVTPKGRLNFSPAKVEAIKAQGGEFAQLAMSGNGWVWTRDATAYSGKRKAVATAEAAALADLQAAKSELEEARKLRSGVVAGSAVDNATAMVLSTQKQRFEQWTSKRATTRTVTLVIVWGSLIVVLISVIAQAAQGKVEEVRTISDVAADALEGIHDAFIEIMDAGQAGVQWARSKTFGVIAHPLPIAKTLPSTAPTQSIPYPHANTAASNGLTFVTIEEANQLLEGLIKLRDKAVTDGDNDLATKLKRDIEQLQAKIDAFVTGQQTGQKSRQAHKNKAKAKSHVTPRVTKKGRDIVPLSKRTDDQLLAARRKALQRDKDGTLGEAGRRNLSRYEAELSRRGFNLTKKKA